MDLQVLRNEFEAGDGSFLIAIKGDMVWDVEAFDRLWVAMEQYCRTHAGSKMLERWVAQGFWFVPGFVRSWTSHPEFPREFSMAYYESAYSRLDELAYYYFSADFPYPESYVWEPIQP